MHNKAEGDEATFMEAIKFFLKRVVRLTPFNLFIIGFGACLGPTMGGGPYWDLYSKTFEPCNKYWWTNVLFIHNFYPAAFDEKCMGWTWIISCYM
jgi:peptidoglycan/LPS O-acetylase OafA/YrhL